MCVKGPPQSSKLPRLPERMAGEWDVRFPPIADIPSRPGASVRFRPIADIYGACDCSPVNKEALTSLGQYLHQDIDLEARSPTDLAEVVLSMMTAEERQNLRAYLSTAMARHSPAELKGQLNRVSENWRFKTKGAAQFLQAMAEQLDV
jgi:hypothetical protein